MLHNGKNHHYDWSHAERFALEIMQAKPRIQLSIAGGEPTVSPFLKDLVRLFTDRGHTVIITSNGVRSGSYWDDCKPDYLCLSYHAEFDDGQWIKRAIDTQKRVPITVARIMMDPKYWDQCVDTYKFLSKTDLGVEAVRILDWGTRAKITYTAEQLDWLHRAEFKQTVAVKGADLHSATAVYFDGTTISSEVPWANTLINQKKNYFTGWQCDIGLHSLFVQFDGSYRRGNCRQGDYIGWIQDKPKLPTDSVICELDHCHCTADVIVPKRLIPIVARQ